MAVRARLVAVQADVDLEDGRGFPDERVGAVLDDELVEVRDVEAVERAPPSRAFLLGERRLAFLLEPATRRLELLVGLHLAQGLLHERSEALRGYVGGGGGRGASRDGGASVEPTRAVGAAGHAHTARRSDRTGGRDGVHHSIRDATSASFVVTARRSSD